MTDPNRQRTAPIDEPSPRTALGPLNAPDPWPQLSMRILVAEDHQNNRLILSRILGATGAEVLLASNGKEAVRQWTNKPVDLILMDMRMPEADGPWAAREIRRLEAELGRERTPIIALTGNGTEEALRAAEAAGMDGQVTKPIQIRPLFAAIMSFVRVPQRTRTTREASEFGLPRVNAKAIFS